MCHSTKKHCGIILLASLVVTFAGSGCVIEVDGDGNNDGAEDSNSASNTSRGGAFDGFMESTATSCGIMIVKRQECHRGGAFTDYIFDCVENTPSCVGLVPSDEFTVNDSTQCIYRTDHYPHTFTGTCEEWYAYGDDQIECVVDAHCSDKRACTDGNTCVCIDPNDCPAVGAPQNPTGDGETSGEPSGDTTSPNEGPSEDGGTSTEDPDDGEEGSATEEPAPGPPPGG